MFDHGPIDGREAKPGSSRAPGLRGAPPTRRARLAPEALCITNVVTRMHCGSLAPEALCICVCVVYV